MVQVSHHCPKLTADTRIAGEDKHAGYDEQQHKKRGVVDGAVTWVKPDLDKTAKQYILILN